MSDAEWVTLLVELADKYKEWASEMDAARHKIQAGVSSDTALADLSVVTLTAMKATTAALQEVNKEIKGHLRSNAARWN